MSDVVSRDHLVVVMTVLLLSKRWILNGKNAVKEMRDVDLFALPLNCDIND